MRRFLIVAVAVLALAAVACDSDAEVASRNVSKAADQFEIQRRVVFFNGITDTYLLSIEGRCSIEADTVDGQLEVICQLDDEKFVKHFLGLSDNVSYFVEQTESVLVDTYRYRVIFKPSVILPDIDTQIDPEPGTDRPGDG